MKNYIRAAKPLGGQNENRRLFKPLLAVGNQLSFPHDKFNTRTAHS
jgi:hypothetical protein